MKIGILGGSFNPIHKGHLHIAREVLEKTNLDKILFIPTFRAPHKEQPNLLPAFLRLEIIEKVIGSNPRMGTSDVEIRREGRSYTVDTLRELKKKHPEWELHFIIGTDMVPTLFRWREIHEILKLCQFIIVNRSTFPLDWENLQGFTPEEKEALIRGVISITPVEISSSDIRKRLEKGEAISHLVPKIVEEILSGRPESGFPNLKL